MKSRRTFLGFAGSAALMGCGESPFGADAAPDAGLSDAPFSDSAPPEPDAGGVDAGPEMDDGFAPILSRFRVQADQPDRLYFDSSKRISSASATGFVISGKEIEDLAINPGSRTGHYFTIAGGFTFWDNNTIRYDGSGAFSDHYGQEVHALDLQYVVNDIPEPEAPVNRFVSPDATGRGDGISEENAWTFVQAGTSADAGQTVWIKAGNYGDINVQLLASGTPSSPIKYVGYKNTPGDIRELTWSHPDNVDVDPTELPVLEGSGASDTIGLRIRADNLVIRNLWVTRHRLVIDGTGRITNVLLDRTIASASGSGGKCFMFASDAHKRLRIKDSVGYNGGTAIFRIYGEESLMEGCRVINDDRGNDYYMNGRGNNNIYRNLYIERFVGHSGHGMSLKSDAYREIIPVEHNLCEHIRIKGVGLAIEARKWDVRYNVFRDIHCSSSETVPQRGSGCITIQGGASFNVFDNIRGENISAGTIVTNITADNASSGHDNIIKNSNFVNARRGIRYSPFLAGKAAYGDRYINCNFVNVGRLIANSSPDVRDNQLINCNVVGAERERSSDENPLGYTYDSCNFNSNGFPAPSGVNIQEEDPRFIDSDNGNLHLRDDSPVRKMGTDTEQNRYDMEGNERVFGSVDIGAHQNNNET